MDHLVDMGNRWACAAAHAVASPSLEAEMCGSSVARTTVGVVTVIVAFLLAVVIVTRIAAEGAGRG